MSQNELESRYSELRRELDEAYGQPEWDASRIDAITEAMRPVEQALSGTGPAARAKTPARR